MFGNMNRKVQEAAAHNEAVRVRAAALTIVIVVPLVTMAVIVTSHSFTVRFWALLTIGVGGTLFAVLSAVIDARMTAANEASKKRR